MKTNLWSGVGAVWLGLFVVGCGGTQQTAATTPETVNEEPVVTESVAQSSSAGAPEQTIERLPRHETKGSSRPATAAERARIDGIVRRTEGIRGLRFRKPVRIEIEDHVAITKGMLEQIEEEDVERARKIYTPLGLLPPGMDIRAMLGSVIGEQVVGYYDPKTSRLVVRDDVIAGLGGAGNNASSKDETQAILIHELVHALQAQHLDLDSKSEKKRTSDAQNAYASVVEGDATLAMMGDVFKQQGLPLSAAAAGIQQFGGMLDASAVLPGEQLQSAPPIVRVTLVAPYLRGLRFTAGLYARGAWRAVNRAHTRPPESTEQVLHAQKYAAREPVEDVRVPRIPALAKAGYKRSDKDTLGELEIGVYLGQSSSTGVDETAAAGWAGDTLQTFARGEATAVVWIISWDSIAEADEAEAAARTVPNLGDSDLLIRDGRVLLIVRSLEPSLHDAVRRVFSAEASRINRRKPPAALVRSRRTR